MYKLNIKEICLELLLVIFVTSVTANLPDHIEKCKAGDKECIINDISNIFSKSYEGDSSFALESLEPLKLSTIDIKEDPKSPVRVHLTFKNGLLYGLKNAKAVKVSGFGTNPTGQHRILLKVPYLSLLADYKIDGNILILPITGHGKSNITISNTTFKININGDTKIKNDKVYMDVKSTNLNFETDRVYIQLNDLFNGDQALSDNINLFLNENWREIYHELKSYIIDGVNTRLQEIIANVFSSTPYAELLEI